MIWRNKGDEYEVLTVPMQALPSVVGEGDSLADLGELEEGEIRGFASVFGMVVDAFTPTIMRRGAFTKTLQERSRNIPILWQHFMDEPIGRPTRLFETEEGLILQAKLSRTTRGKEAMTLIRDKVVDAFSIGFEAINAEFEEVEGQRIRFVREARLVEISVVTLGADPNARILEARNAGHIPGSLDRYVVGTGFEARHHGKDEEHDTEETETPAEKRNLAERFTTFAAEHRTANPDATEADIAVAFAATLHEAEPTPGDTGTESLTLSEVEQRLMEAELLSAQMDLDTL